MLAAAFIKVFNKNLKEWRNSHGTGSSFTDDEHQQRVPGR